MTNSFKLTITPNVTKEEILDVSFYGKSYDLETSIDPTWFKQTKITQHANMTELEVDFNLSDTDWEIHDSFLPDLLWVLEDLGKHTNKKYIVNSESLTVTGGVGEIKSITTIVKDNEIINDVVRNEVVSNA